MGFKKTTRNLDFADLAMATCLEQNRSIKLMEQLNNTINWARVESILLSHYTGGHQRGRRPRLPAPDAVQMPAAAKWFRIPSDPELENQITDRCPSKPFWGFPSADAPDHYLLPLPQPAAQAGHGCDQLRDPAPVRAARAFHQRGRCRGCPLG